MKRIFAVLFCIGTFHSKAADWMQFRGPDTGVAAQPGLPHPLDAEHNVVWKTALPGRGISSPIIIGDRIFVTSSSGTQQDHLHILCFNARDGSKLWEREFWATGRTTCHEKISVAAPTPVSDGRHIFALFSSNDLFCLDLDGNLLWLRGLMRDYPNASNGLGLAASPLIVDGVFIAQVETDGEAFVLGIDETTGRNLWKIERPRKANWTSPIVLRGANHKPLIILQSSSGITAVTPSTGEVIWQFTEGAATLPSCALIGDILFVPSSGVTALQIDSDGRSFKELWRSNQLRPSTASPLASGDRIFTLNDAGVLTCGDTKDGKRLWQLRLAGPISASPVAAGRFIYIANEKGLIQVVDATSDEGSIMSQLDLGESFIGTPSLAHDSLYLRSDAHLWKIGPR